MDSKSVPAQGTSSRARQIAERISQVAAISISLLAVGVLLGWLLDIRLLKTVLPGYKSMKANTALEFLFSGVSLGLIGQPNGRAIRRVLSWLVAAVAFLTLLEYALGRSLGIDELLFHDGLSPRYPGRMAPTTASSFLIVGAAYA
jgi:hypothetical protein